MIGELITSCLLLVLGYAYPAFQCFKTVEKNRVEIPELRFWCQYWIIVAIITILEKIGDVFISMVANVWRDETGPLYLLVVSKNKGHEIRYDTLLRPYMSMHEMDIDRSLIEFRDRAWNLAIYYWQNCTELGSTKILQFLQFVASQGGRSSQSTSQTAGNQEPNGDPSLGLSKRSKPDKPRPDTSHRNQTPKPETTRVELHNHQTQFIRPEDVLVQDSNLGHVLKDKSSLDDDVHAVKHRLRRFIDRS